ncbi:MAG: ATP-dependent helicase, partial [Rhodoferax sp.]
LLRNKIELEPIEFEENLPDIRKQGHINDGRRLYQAEESGVRRDEYASRNPRAPRQDYRRSVPIAQDPFFDKPYEPALPGHAAAAWEATPARPGVRTISSNIKSKRKVAALFSAA